MYDPIDPGTRGLTLLRVLLTICAIEFFGPWGRDFSDSHVFNPTWVGHARLHMMWLLGYFLFSGIGVLWLVWGPRPQRLVHLCAACMWIAANFLGFWGAVATAGAYGGLVVVPGIHVFVLGIEENVFAFSILSAIFMAALGVLLLVVRPQVEAASRR
ncbi:MAG: hypothetical protein ACKOCT_16860 [Alphaproteobacteria bacterium]